MEAATPTVSVYIAAYQAERWIADAISSCLDQTLAPMEVLVVDDASTDRTSALVRAIDDPRVVLITLTENRGPGAARNVALDRAQGEWLAVMDADDRMFSRRLEALTRAAESEPSCSIVMDALDRHPTERALNAPWSRDGSRSLGTHIPG